jgi:hypothetical protein
MNLPHELERYETRRGMRNSGSYFRPFIDGVIIAFSVWMLALLALLAASYMNLDSAPTTGAGNAQHALSTVTAGAGGPGHAAYFLAAAIACWSVESVWHQVKRGESCGAVITRIGVRTALIGWLIL